MDERQQQIQVGAGLQESRLNTDLIAWLEKWGTWILAVLCVVVLSYVGWNYYQKQQREVMDKALAAFNTARGTLGIDGIRTGSPDGLLAVSREHPRVATLASMEAAEIFLGSARRGVRPGGNVLTPATEDVLTPEQQTEMLTQAATLFSEAKSRTDSSVAMAMLNMRARLGIAAVAISKGDFDQAKATLSEMEDRATKLGLTEHAAEAKRRLELLPKLAVPTELFRDADLAAIPGTAPENLDAGALQDASNPQFERMPEGFVPPGMAAPGAPIQIEPSAPAPQPAPAPAPPAQTPPAQPEQPKPATP
jgi:predicted negative regulator of RcsB-dependent stress response